MGWCSSQGVQQPDRRAARALLSRGEVGDESFGLADDDVVGFDVGGGHAAGDGAADNGAQAALTASFDDGEQRVVLRHACR